MQPDITSLHNHRVKAWMQLYKSSVRHRSERFLVEGIKECNRGLDSMYVIDELILCDALLPEAAKVDLLRKVPESCTVFMVDKKVYAKLSYRKSTEGVIGVFKKIKQDLALLQPKTSGMELFLILENIEKPGNLGAILRTADGVGARGVILCGSSTDQYNPNAIRSSLGTIFTIPVVQATPEEILQWANAFKIQLWSAALPAYQDLYEIMFSGPTGLVFGAEDAGLSSFWIEDPKFTFTIPMQGLADSLNLSVSVGVASYEFLRQAKTDSGR